MLKVVNPADGTVIEQIPSVTRVQLEEAVDSSRRAQEGWRNRSLEDRAETMRRFRKLLKGNVDQAAKKLSLEVGKPLKQAKGEIFATLARIDFFVEHFTARMATQKVYADDSVSEEISFEPHGVIANISAWNYPYFVGSNVFVPALLTGNAVVYKPSEFSLMTGMMIGDLMQQAGVPADVFQTVVGDGSVGSRLVQQKIDGVFFTGSFTTGRKVNLAAADRLLRVGMELGGKDPCYVTEHVDPAKVAEAVADGAFYNTGQSCCAVERIYVHKSIAAEFKEALVEVVKGFVVGDPMDQKTYIGPLARSQQLATLTAQVEQAQSKGAKILVGGKRIEGPGNFFQPTVCADVDHSMALMSESAISRSRMATRTRSRLVRSADARNWPCVCRSSNIWNRDSWNGWGRA